MSAIEIRPSARQMRAPRLGRMFDSGTDALYTAFLTLDLIWRIGLQRRNKKMRESGFHLQTLYRRGGDLGLVVEVAGQPGGGSNGYTSGVTTTSVVKSSGKSFGGVPGPGNVSSIKNADHP